MTQAALPATLPPGEWRALLEAQRQAYLQMVDAIERALGVTPRAAELRREAKERKRERAA